MGTNNPRYNALRRQIHQVYRARMRGLDRTDYDIRFEEFLALGLFKRRWVHLWTAKRKAMRYSEWIWLPWLMSPADAKRIKHLTLTKQARPKVPLEDSCTSGE